MPADTDDPATALVGGLLPIAAILILILWLTKGCT